MDSDLQKMLDRWGWIQQLPTGSFNLWEKDLVNDLIRVINELQELRNGYDTEGCACLKTQRNNKE